jgi:hypothetical protein
MAAVSFVLGRSLSEDAPIGERLGTVPDVTCRAPTVAVCGATGIDASGGVDDAVGRVQPVRDGVHTASSTTTVQEQNLRADTCPL